jgi:hypothetical protein
LSQPCTAVSCIGSALPDKPARRAIKTLHLTHSNCRRGNGAPWSPSRSLGQVGEPHLTQRGWSPATNDPAIGNLRRKSRARQLLDVSLMQPDRRKKAIQFRPVPALISKLVIKR